MSNKLFQDLKLENTEIVKVIGGLLAHTENGSDTDPIGGGYDVLFFTKDKNCTDSAKTDNDDSTSTDKPLPKSISAN